MGKFRIKTLALAAALLCTAAYASPSPQGATAVSSFRMGGETDDMVKWVESAFARGSIPPFSFILDEVPSSQFIRSWKWAREILPASGTDVYARRYSYTEPSGKMKAVADVHIYPEFRSVEWVVRLQNLSSDDSGRLTGVKVLDVASLWPASGNFNFHYAEGNRISKSDYAPRTRVLRTGETLSLSPASGRSSEEEFPFFNIESEASSRGMMISVGWTGTWSLELRKNSPASLSLSCGQKTFDAVLHPSEEIRTPSIAMLLWEGDRMKGHNAFRRFVLTHHSRKVDGKVDYPLCSGFNYRDPYPFSEYSAITANWAVAMIERYAQFSLLPDVFWLDAGWHTGADDYRNGKNWASTCGNWTVDGKRFPQGLKPVSDAAHRYGAKFMVWFEPERVVRGTQWAVEHPQWMLETDWPEGSEESTWLLFNLADDEACDWLCKYYGDLIEENGIDYYRQDCNVKPAKYWADADEPGRKGMTENKYVTNLYRFWDYLLERFPGMLIDNCASGGKRLDWESIGRSAPLWRSDYYHHNDPDGYQCHTYGLNYFLPVHGTGILLPDQYSFRSSLSSALIYNWKVTDKGNSYVEMQDRIREYREIKPYYYEDYYPLSGTGDLTGDDIWLAYQMHRPSDGTGIVLAFRRRNAAQSEYPVRLGGLEPDAEYELTDSDTLRKEIYSGSALMDALVLRLENPGSSLLIRYRKI